MTKYVACIVLCSTVSFFTASAHAAKPIRNHVAWTDTAGKPISCHDGGILRVGDTFYWYGTSYRGNPQGLWDAKPAMCDQWFRGPKGQRVPIDQSCQLRLPVSFDPNTDAAKMHHVAEWNAFP